MEESITLTMINEGFFKDIRPVNFEVTYKNVRNHPNILKDIIKYEIEYYGKDYGEDFCRRKFVRYFNKIKEAENGFDMWVVCKDDKVIAYAYTYNNGKLVSLDGLLTIKEYRNNGVTSNLFKHLTEVYKCPIFLHAEEDDEPKILYEKLGFKSVYKTYDYLTVDEAK